MNTLRLLGKADILSFANWYRTQTVSRLIVSFLFTGLFALLASAGYFLSLGFFRGLTGYEIYGQLSAVYLLGASIVVIFWFALAASITAGISFLLTRDNKIDYLLSLPLSPLQLQIWFFMRTFLLNTFLFLIMFTPIALAFSKTFGDGFSISFVISFVAVVIFLVAVSNSAGSVLAYVLAPVIKEKKTWAAMAGAFCFIASLIGIISLIFPKQIFTLAEADNQKFWAIYQTLPLASPVMPSSWLTYLIVSRNMILALVLIAVSVSIAYLTVKFTSRKFISLFQLLSEYGHNLPGKNPAFARGLSKTKQPIFYKDWLSIIRSPAEITYALFLLLLGIVFFLLLAYAKQIRFSSGRFETELILFSFAWLSFFAMAFLLRLSFPLMAKEGVCPWYIFSLPIKRLKLLDSKILSGTVLACPYFILGAVLWKIMPFGITPSGELAVITLFNLFSISLLLGFAGVIVPNFSEGSQPEKVSTSITGIMSIILSGGLVALQIILLHGVLTNNLNRGAVWLGIIPNLAAVFLLYVSARISLSKYQF